MSYVTDNQRSFGLPPADQVTAEEQLQRSYPRVGVQQLPEGVPGITNGQHVGIVDPMGEKPLKFVMFGDSGGIMDAAPQRHVANAMIGSLDSNPDTAFAYHVGDEVYFNGNADQYVPQFYEPYAHFNRPIVGVPGNHDGEVSVDDAGNPTGRLPLDTFMANFCDEAPRIPIVDQQFEYGRHTQTQPYCDWALMLHDLTIVGLYSNVPSGGHLFDSQVQWLTDTLKSAPKNVPLMLVLHHPPYSVDAHHGGSKHMGDAIDKAVSDSGNVWPTMVVSGHVHDYQRFDRAANTSGVFGVDLGLARHVAHIPYIVIGNSGYHNLHRLAKNATAGASVAPNVTFEAGDDRNWGFIHVSVNKGSIACTYTSVDKFGAVNVLDTFRVVS